MNIHKTTSKAGTPLYLPIADGDFIEAASENTGLCIACGEEVYGIEPDARRYKCESCGALKVFGLEELANMALVR